MGKDADDAILALVSGGIGAALGYGSATPKIKNLEVQIRALIDENNMLRGTLHAKDAELAQKDQEIRKLKEQLGKKN